MKRSLLCVLLLLLAFSAWGHGYKITIDAQVPYKLYFADEAGLREDTEPDSRIGGVGVSVWIYHEDAEYMVLLIAIAEPALIRIDLAYLDSEDRPLAGKPVRLSIEGTFGGLRVKHPCWCPAGV